MEGRQVLSLPVGEGFSIDYYLDESGSPVSVSTGARIEDPALLDAVRKQLETAEEATARTLKVGSGVLKYILDQEGNPVTLKTYEAITDPVLLDAIKKELVL